NPNYKRNDTASSTYMEIKELASVEWSSTKLVLRVPPELHYYAVNQAEIEPRVKNKDGKLVPYKDNYVDKRGATYFQAHRWVESLPRGREVLPIGEWAVAERFQVFRGEYVGRSERVEVPRWLPNLEDFVILTDGSGRSGVPVNLGYERADGKE